MPAIQVNEIYKTFGAKRAVDQVSFEVHPGEIFGLLGPNGAGKTTTIRIILDIFKPDKGSVSILGGPMNEEKKEHIGYLPEERGLYQDIPLERCLLYLASLKGLSGKEARLRLNTFLEKFNLTEYRTKKIKELSKGMQQKAQLIATLIHRPELIIIDEPFSSLDPVNTQMVKDILEEERQRGTTLVMCTHQMHQVEELCDRLVLINQGRTILYGSLSEIRRKFSGQGVVLRTPSTLPPIIQGIEAVDKKNDSYHLKLTPDSSPQQVLHELVRLDVQIEQFEIAVPDLDEIFIQVVKTDGSEA